MGENNLVGAHHAALLNPKLATRGYSPSRSRRPSGRASIYRDRAGFWPPTLGLIYRLGVETSRLRAIDSAKVKLTVIQVGCARMASSVDTLCSLRARDWSPNLNQVTPEIRGPRANGTTRPSLSDRHRYPARSAHAGNGLRPDGQEIRLAAHQHSLAQAYVRQYRSDEEHPSKVVSEMLGHSKIALTLDTYSHVLPGARTDAAHQIASALTGSR